MLFSFVCLIETWNNETKFVIFGKDVCDVNFLTFLIFPIVQWLVSISILTPLLDLYRKFVDCCLIFYIKRVSLLEVSKWAIMGFRLYINVIDKCTWKLDPFEGYSIKGSPRKWTVRMGTSN